MSSCHVTGDRDGERDFVTRRGRVSSKTRVLRQLTPGATSLPRQHGMCFPLIEHHGKCFLKPQLSIGVITTARERGLLLYAKMRRFLSDSRVCRSRNRSASEGFRAFRGTSSYWPVSEIMSGEQNEARKLRTAHRISQAVKAPLNTDLAVMANNE